MFCPFFKEKILKLLKNIIGKKFLQKEICLIYLENITLILDGTVLKINLRAKNVKNHAFLRGSKVSKFTRFAASFSASSQVTSESFWQTAIF